MSPEIGGHSVPSVGFGSGVERIILGLKEAGIEPPAAVEPPVLIAHFGGVTKVAATQLAFRLRHAGIGTWVAFASGRRSMKSQMREADKRAVRYVLVLGESEIEKASLLFGRCRAANKPLSIQHRLSPGSKRPVAKR